MHVVSRTVLVKLKGETEIYIYFYIFSRDDLCSLKVLSEVDLKRRKNLFGTREPIQDQNFVIKLKYH